MNPFSLGKVALNANVATGIQHFACSTLASSDRENSGSALVQAISKRIARHRHAVPPSPPAARAQSKPADRGTMPTATPCRTMWQVDSKLRLI